MAELKEAKTIADVRDLLREFEVVLSRNGSVVIVTWPSAEQDGMHGYGGRLSAAIEDCISTPWTGKPAPLGCEDIAWKRHVRMGIMSLVDSGRFWRLTTTAHHLGSYFSFHSQFGKVKTRKKPGEPFRCEFETEAQAVAFMEAAKGVA